MARYARKTDIPGDNKTFIIHALRLILFYQSKGFGNKSFYESHSHKDITLAKSKLETNSTLQLKYM